MRWVEDLIRALIHAVNGNKRYFSDIEKIFKRLELTKQEESDMYYLIRDLKSIQSRAEASFDEYKKIKHAIKPLFKDIETYKKIKAEIKKLISQVNVDAIEEAFYKMPIEDIKKLAQEKEIYNEIDWSIDKMAKEEVWDKIFSDDEQLEELAKDCGIIAQALPKEEEEDSEEEVEKLPDMPEKLSLKTQDKGKVGLIKYPKSGKATIEKYKRLLKAKTWNEQEILSVKHYLNDLSRWPENTDPQLAELIQDILDSFSGDKEVNISPEQSSKGIIWLRNNVVDRKGELRNNAMVRDSGFTSKEAEVINNFKKFTFVGFDENHQSYYTDYNPIYRTYAKNGDYFDYYSFGGRFSGGSKLVLVQGA